MPRQARLEMAGVLQHVIARGIERRKIFFDGRDYRFFMERLVKLLGDTEIECLAWALIPNHIHLFLRIQGTPLSTFMRSLMTSYAAYFNRRHHRSGHLFQNRYKSIICEEDPYLLELVRHIHLNPLRAGLVKDLGALEKYPFCGHGGIVGRDPVPWQTCVEVLGYFSKRLRSARLNYKKFMTDGINEGKRPEFGGGGILKELKKKGRLQYGTGTRGSEEEILDPRVLGTGDFVERVLGEGKREKESLVGRGMNWWSG